MDRHAWWLRRAIIRTVAVRCALVALVGGVLVHLFVATRAGDAAIERFGSSLLIGQLIAAVWFVIAISSNPLSYQYLQTHLAAASWYEPVVAGPDPHAVTAELMALGMRNPIRAVPSEAEAGEGFDLLASKDGLIIGAVSRGTGELSLMTRLTDGRVAHSARLLVAPNEGMVVNTAPGGGTRELIEAHAGLIGDLAAKDIEPVPATPRLWLDVMALERASYEQIGPLLGSLCNLANAPHWGRLMVSVSPAEVRALSISPKPTEGQTSLPPPSRTAVVDPGVRPGARSLDPVAG